MFNGAKKKKKNGKTRKSQKKKRFPKVFFYLPFTMLNSSVVEFNSKNLLFNNNSAELKKEAEPTLMLSAPIRGYLISLNYCGIKTPRPL